MVEKTLDCQAYILFNIGPIILEEIGAKAVIRAGGFVMVHFKEDCCYNGRERETNNELKSNKTRQQIYVVHQFGYFHGRERIFYYERKTRLQRELSLILRIKQLG